MQLEDNSPLNSLIDTRQSHDGTPPPNINNSSLASSTVGRIFVQHPSQGEPTLAMCPDPVTLNELYDIDPPDGIARNETFDRAAAEFLTVVDLASTWSKKKAKALIEDFRKTLVEVRLITQSEIARMEALQGCKIKPGAGE